MNLIGHEKQLDQLRKAAGPGQLANAYLLTGPEGVGKKLAAQTFAMELFPPEQHQKILHWTHPDILLVSVEEGRKEITIEQMLRMQGQIQMRPMEGKYKIIVIDDAEKMNASAANSALKVLEEPPPLTHFFLITSREHMLPPTILSRCQKIRFSPPPVGKIIPLIKERRGIDDETARLVSLLSLGSIGRALNFPLDILKEVVDTVKRLWSGAAPSEIISIAERWGKSDIDHEAVLTVLTGLYTDIALHQASKRSPSFFPLKDRIERISSDTPPETIMDKLKLLSASEQETAAPYNKQLMFERLLFTLAG